MKESTASLLVMLTGGCVGSAGACLVLQYLYDLDPLPWASVCGYVCGVVGAVAGENFLESLVFAVMCVLLILLPISCVPQPLPTEAARIAFPTVVACVVGACLGKLVFGAYHDWIA